MSPILEVVSALNSPIYPPPPLHLCPPADGRIYKIFMARDTAGGGMKPVVSEIIQV